MNYFLTTISHSTTGVKTITCGFQPVAAKITVSAKSGGQTVSHQSVGVTDGVNTVCDSWYQDAIQGKTNRYTDRIVSQWEFDTGTSTFIEKVKAAFDSFTATQFKYNNLTADINYQYLIEVWG